ncbi:hypothetical protein LCGC14_3011930 [marine sediment metagenome]|uniref:Uncharacterized protein n=1 Tax=marine sediment metagenome TaxID=412755 RepID=A0A0F8XKQ3_9ZZZZ
MRIVDGDIFLTMPNGMIFRDINLQTGKPIGPKMIKTFVIKDVCDKDAIGYYYKFAATGEECSARMNCPAACKFLIIDAKGVKR